jgi:hypothetical protein
MRAAGLLVQEIADELDSSQGSASELLRQARTGSFPRFVRGHALRKHDPTRDGPTKAMQAETVHEHRWRSSGSRLIGGVLFRIDVCVIGSCPSQRACRPSGPGSIPAPPRAPRARRKM